MQMIDLVPNETENCASYTTNLTVYAGMVMMALGKEHLKIHHWHTFLSN